MNVLDALEIIKGEYVLAFTDDKEWKNALVKLNNNTSENISETFEGNDFIWITLQVDGVNHSSVYPSTRIKRI